VKKLLTGISLGLAVLTLTAVTFSWIIDTSGTEAHQIYLDYGGDSGHTMTVSPNSIQVALGTKDSQGTFTECDEESFLNLNGLYPTASVTYYMRLTNVSEVECTLSIYFQNITARKVKNSSGQDTSLLDVIYVNVVPTDASSDDIASNSVYVPFNDVERLEQKGDQYNFLLMSGLKLATTGTEGFVEYECRFTMSAEAGNIYQNLDIHIDRLRIVC